jgi:hypothetical protein
VLTVNEQAQLQNAATLLSSNLFKLQVGELLQEVDRQKTYTNSQLSAFITTFTELLQTASASAVSEGHIPETLNAKWLAQTSIKSAVPFSNNTSVHVKFAPIEEVCVVGSFSTQTVTHPIINIDIAFTIPSMCVDRYSDHIMVADC